MYEQLPVELFAEPGPEQLYGAPVVSTLSATAAHQLFESVTQNATPAPADLVVGKVAFTVAATVPASKVVIG